MKKLIIYIVPVILLLTGCMSFLEDIEPAGGSVSNEQLAEMTKKDPELVLGPMWTGAEIYLHNGDRATTDRYGFKNWNLALDLMGNDVVLLNPTNWFQYDYLMADYRKSTDTRPAQMWGNYYKMVYMANQILELIPEEANQAALLYKAKALTTRSMAYYYLLNIYQLDYLNGGKDMPGVPHVTSLADPDKPRETTNVIYAAIIEDLNTAIGIFEGANYDVHASKTDVDQSVANLVLARAAVTFGDYTTAASAAAKVIALYTLAPESEYVSTATSSNSGFHSLAMSEAIWGYEFSQSNRNSNNSHASFTSPVANGYGNAGDGSPIAIASDLYNLMSNTDYRKKNFVADNMDVTDANSKPVTLVKYTSLKLSSLSFDTDEIYMRASEAYLLKAEAEARDGKAAAAQQTLFDLVSQRDTGYTKSSKTGAELLSEIFNQWRIEMWCEGHSWFLLKRFNVGVDRSNGTNHVHQAKHEPGKAFVFLLPLNEMTYNTALVEADQNPL